MKKNNKNNYTRFSFIGFLLFFLTLGLTSTFSIFVYHFSIKGTNHNTFVVAICVFFAILVGALVCTLLDIIRRKYMGRSRKCCRNKQLP